MGKDLRGLFAATLFAAIHLAACVTSTSATCEDGTVCPDGARCMQGAPEAPYTCASPAQQAACVAASEGAPCEVPVPGNCYDGVCTPPVCGNARTDRGEVCDDGDANPGGACSADCTSTNACGNGIIDAEVGEQCDVGPAGLGGDGCSSECKVEYRLWRDVEPGLPLPRRLAVLAPDPGGDGVILFGGGDLPGIGDIFGPGFARPLIATALGDTWRWDGTAWRSIVSTVRPPPRAAMASAYDPVRGRIVMFGGRDASGTTFDDTWEFDGVRWDRKAANASAPSKRYGATMACAPQGCVLFGGFDASDSPLADTWGWTGAGWVELAPTTSPPARGLATMAPDLPRNRLVLHGGLTGLGFGGAAYVDTWALIPSTAGGQLMVTWQEILTKATPPSTGPNTATISQAVFDPSRDEVLLTTDVGLWQLERDLVGGSESWSALGTAAEPAIHGATWDPRRGTVIGIGPTMAQVHADKDGSWSSTTALLGAMVSGPISAVYEPRRGVTIALSAEGTLHWDGRGYSRAVPAADSPAPGIGNLAYDRVCDRGVVFGSGTARIPSAATLFYEPAAAGGPRWTPGPAAPTALTARTGAMLAFDERRGVTVMFGGQGAGAPLDDVWELSSSSCGAPAWVPRATSMRPPGRTGGTLTYDPINDVTVLFGGMASMSGSTMPTADVWHWKDGTWTDVTPLPSAPAPRPREGHAAAFDPGYRRVVVFGGRTDEGPTDETWAWDAKTRAWQNVEAVVTASPVANHALARDARGLVQLGGSVPGRAWRLTSEQVLDPPERCELATQDADGDQLAGCDDPDCWTRCDPTCRPDDDPSTTCPALRATCGDGVCDRPREDHALCPLDCMPPGM